MGFAVLPPEINSARLHLGPGVGPMLAAAAAWDGLASELGSAEASFSAATARLAGAGWQGAAATAMTGAAAPVLAWLGAATAQAEQTAVHTRMAVAAFEAALAATVRPAVISANRARLVSLVVSNVLGQNAPAIAAAEAAYEQMWAQDVAAMFGYHSGAAAAASMLTPFERGLLGPGGAGLSRVAAGATQTVARNAGTLGLANIGFGNIGSGNVGDFNIGFGNIGSTNTGSGNIGTGNLGFGNVGPGMTAALNNIGLGNTGSNNIGLGNTAATTSASATPATATTASGSGARGCPGSAA